MPATHVHAFILTGLSGGAKSVWKREDGDDQALIAYMQTSAAPVAQNFTVEDSETETRLKWQVYAYQYPSGWVATGTYASIAIQPEDYIEPRYDSYPYPGPPRICDMTGRWESDVYGRPFDINGLLSS